MSALPLQLVPNPTLHQKAHKVAKFGPELKELAEAMVATMRASHGMGLAAPQVNHKLRLIVVEYLPEDSQEPAIPLTVLANPTITDSSRQTDWLDEGCLSIPYLELPIERPVEVNILAQDLNGQRLKIRARGLMARVLQHEIDHLNGILITDRAYPNLDGLAGRRLIFAGSPDLALPYLSALAASPIQLVGVITAPDKPAGRRRQVKATPVKELANQLGLAIIQPEHLSDPSLTEQLRQWQPEIAVVVGYGQLIPPRLLDSIPFGWLNVHFSLLPAYRGPSPHQTAILDGKTETGVTFFKLDPGLDTGPILSQVRVAITPTETSGSLIAKLVLRSVGPLLSDLGDYLTDQKQLRVQNDRKATKTCLITKEDGRLDWSRPADQLDRQIRAMQPWPAAFTVINGQRLQIHEARLAGDKLVLNVVQPAGGRPMTFHAYLHGKPDRLTFFHQTGKVKLD